MLSEEILDEGHLLEDLPQGKLVFEVEVGVVVLYIGLQQFQEHYVVTGYLLDEVLLRGSECFRATGSQRRFGGCGEGVERVLAGKLLRSVPPLNHNKCIGTTKGGCDYNMIIFRVKYCASAVKARFLHKLEYQPTLFHLRNYLYTYLFAKSANGSMVTLYDETTLQSPEVNAETFHDYLHWLNIYPESKEEAPRMMNEFKPAYGKHLKQLDQGNQLYRCFCKKSSQAYDGTCRSLTHEQVQQMLKAKLPYRVRLKQPETTLKYSDLVYGDVEDDPREDPVINDPMVGMTTQFKAVVADQECNVTHIFHNNETLK